MADETGVEDLAERRVSTKQFVDLVTFAEQIDQKKNSPDPLHGHSLR